MTKQEACKLETTCDALMSHYLKTDCEVSLALSGRLKISFDDGYITINTKTGTVDYISYTGFYSDLQEYIDKIMLCLIEHTDVFNKLIWSYEHRRELEE
jgi:hypothetical protein